MPATDMFGSVTSAQIAHLSCITEAQKIIGYTFRSPGYLFQALQAPGSGVIEIDGRYLARGNECIAIVGDRALGAVLSKDWFTAGWVIKAQWTRNHDRYLSDASLARKCKELNLWQCRQESILQAVQLAGDKAYATLLEAVVGAVFLDAEDGMSAVGAFMVKMGMM